MDDRPGVPLRHDLWRLVHRARPVPAFAGTFIAFEGGEGGGKSTQVQAAAAWLRARGHEVVVTREPGVDGCRGRWCAQLLLDPASELSPRAEALLYAADRAQHVDTLIRPALERGAVVITDRYVDSSLAYQGAGRDLLVEEVARLSGWATSGVRPDLVVLLDVDPEVGLARAARHRGAGPDGVGVAGLPRPGARRASSTSPRPRRSATSWCGPTSPPRRSPPWCGAGSRRCCRSPRPPRRAPRVPS